MRKVVKRVEKEIHDYNAVAVTGPMLEKLFTYSKDSQPTAADITKCVAGLIELSKEGDTIDLSHYADFVAMIK
jgi:hypothetical protein